MDKQKMELKQKMEEEGLRVENKFFSCIPDVGTETFKVKVPFELKNDLRRKFPKAKWERDGKIWRIGFDQKERLKNWLETLESKIAEIEKEHERFKNAKLTKDEIEKTREEVDKYIKEINNKSKQVEEEIEIKRAELNKSREKQKELEKTEEILKNKEEELQSIKAELNEEQKQQEEKETKAQELLEQSGYTLDYLVELRDGLALECGKLRKSGRADMNRVRQILEAFENVDQSLEKIGLASEGIEDLANVKETKLNKFHPEKITKADMLTIKEIS